MLVWKKVDQFDQLSKKLMIEKIFYNFIYIIIYISILENNYEGKE